MYIRVNFIWLWDVSGVILTQCPKPLFVDFSWILDFTYMLIDYECGLIEYGYGMFQNACCWSSHSTQKGKLQRP